MWEQRDNGTLVRLKSGESFTFFEEEGEELSHDKLYTKVNIEDDPDHEYGNWHLLPDLLLEKVFQHLTIRQRYYASQVCRSWYHAFNFPRVWYTFIMHDELLTKRKYNYYAGWQKLLDHFRVTIFLTKKGANIRTLIFQPMSNLFNLYEFLNVACYMKDNCPGTLDNVHTLRFQFECHMSQRAEELVFGTGGQLLTMLKRVMGILSGLRTLELRDLLLDGTEGLQLLDDVCCVCCETLKSLTLINVTKLGHTLLHPGTFINLETLIISPQNIGEDLLELIGNTSLKDMHIIQNKYTENGRSLNPKAWKRCRYNNPRLRIHLCLEGSSKKEIIWQHKAPVKSVVYDSPYSQVKAPVIIQIIELYKSDLEVYAQKQLPRFHMARSFHDRIDSSLLLLTRQCPYLHTLVIREKISTATVLLLAHTAKNLHYLYVRRNALLLKIRIIGLWNKWNKFLSDSKILWLLCPAVVLFLTALLLTQAADWPKNPEWTNEFYLWLCKNARSYEDTEREVSQILGYRWQSMTDKQFKMLKLNLEKRHYMFS
ncbi:uncharacterized protein LOC143036511 isoform X3 [Oratosquilla oratoria]|uniref:uncharacterized protein LOC143036511 isoform X3 n=1 Tax=Oratosquilla oratoria TaxID=337810 RepID=UPI003F759E8A